MDLFESFLQSLINLTFDYFYVHRNVKLITFEPFCILLSCSKPFICESLLGNDSAALKNSVKLNQILFLQDGSSSCLFLLSLNNPIRLSFFDDLPSLSELTELNPGFEFIHLLSEQRFFQLVF